MLIYYISLLILSLIAHSQQEEAFEAFDGVEIPCASLGCGFCAESSFVQEKCADVCAGCEKGIDPPEPKGSGGGSKKPKKPEDDKEEEKKKEQEAKEKAKKEKEKKEKEKKKAEEKAKKDKEKKDKEKKDKDKKEEEESKKDKEKKDKEKEEKEKKDKEKKEEEEKEKKEKEKKEAEEKAKKEKEEKEKKAEEEKKKKEEEKKKAEEKAKKEKAAGGGSDREIRNKRLLDCCKDRLTDPSCADPCSYDVTVETLLESAEEKEEVCPLSKNTSPVLQCAADGNDNTQCCKDKKVDVDFKPVCLDFCKDDFKGTIGSKYLACVDAFEHIIKCHEDNSSVAPYKKRRRRKRMNTGSFLVDILKGLNPMEA